MCAGNFHENERRGFRTLSMSNVRQELPTTTPLAATHEGRVHWHSAEVSLRDVPIEVPSKISPRATLELKARHYHAADSLGSEIGKVD